MLLGLEVFELLVRVDIGTGWHAVLFVSRNSEDEDAGA